MKWIKISVIVLLGVAAALWFAVTGQRVALDGTEAFAFDAAGSLYLLSDEGTLTRVSPDGRRLWTVQLDRETEDGDLMRYEDLVVDRNGSLYIAAQAYERRVDAAGAVQEIILTEAVQTWNSQGQRQDDVMQVDKSALSQYSTEPYIRKLQLQGETLLALCCNQGEFSVIAAYPYGEEEPTVLANYDLGDQAEAVEDCAALSDGTLVCADRGGSLTAYMPDGSSQSFTSLVGSGSLVGWLSADENDRLYYLDRTNGAYYVLNPADYTAERLYSPDSVVDSQTETAFRQLRNVQVAGYGGLEAVAFRGEQPVWVRFGDQTGVIDNIHRGWSGLEVAKVLGVFLGTVAVLSLAGWILGVAFNRSRLIGRILLRFLPAVLVVLALLSAAMLHLLTAERTAALQQSLAAAARAAAAQMDGNALDWNELRQMDAAQWQTLQEQLEQAGQYAAQISGMDEVGVLLYTLEGEDGYGVGTTLERDAFRWAKTLSPLRMEFSEETAETILNGADQGSSVSFDRGGVTYISCFQPIFQADGQTAGLMEARVPQQNALTAVLDRSPVFYGAITVLLCAVVLAIWLLLVLLGAFRPLKELRRCIGEISAGRWNVQARITSGDELADIGLSFNQMTEKLNQYISNMVLLNNEYIKFTPRELFQLLGKTKVTDLNLRDKSIRDMSLLYVQFSLNGAKLDSEAYFDLMNENFDKVFDVVDRNHGIIEHFDGSGMLALFPWQVQDALNTAIALKETMARENSAVELKMLISADELLVGVAGNRKRQTITAISGTIMDLYALTSLMEEMGTRYSITARAVERIDDSCYFNCREIGAGDTGRPSLYEFLDGMDPYEKKLHLVTRTSFEAGIHAYEQGNYYEARKQFADVLQTNERDTVAMYYLMRCDAHLRAEAAQGR
ncbi:HAMP domain-containing protein [Candidatus Avoscillospira sp. LCP25S3_F1]|uniref:HAMP domain-containing protein n=1 Tax=Candidatus Avoscillospira sp. LCP25S3_F1 TaxID=3438825 RepID=UPI003F92AB31